MVVMSALVEVSIVMVMAMPLVTVLGLDADLHVYDDGNLDAERHSHDRWRRR